MQTLIVAGAIVTVLGLAGIVWTLVTILGAKRRGLSPEALQNAIQKVAPINLGALFVSFLGLIMLVAGLILR
ncbi:hypothetical protein BVG79_01604 [Ketogulonicigenium robustum]|uniref:Uncharacterized protein n=1 Tax=Ketogulonicigenium robustum TaxID=92947 RepID=A0A1W6P0B9_9RHOB|nr:hypothetical protein [Ketogulonicigenium robustum]ARO14948.1 hypothetical protein BVG79_01604 [Ketogulonicigenium robustum]